VSFHSIIHNIVTQSFHLEPKNARIPYDQNHTIMCQSIGVPEPTIEWYFRSTLMGNGTFVRINDLDSGKYHQQDESELLITNADDSVVGDYTCVSYSPGLTRNVSANISIFGTYIIFHKLF